MKRAACQWSPICLPCYQGLLTLLQYSFSVWVHWSQAENSALTHAHKQERKKLFFQFLPHSGWLNMTLLLTDETNPSFHSDSFTVFGETLFYPSPLHVHLVPFCLLKASQGTHCGSPTPSGLHHCRLCSKTDYLFPLQHLPTINFAYLLQLTAPWLSARKSYIAFSLKGSHQHFILLDSIFP